MRIAASDTVPSAQPATAAPRLPTHPAAARGADFATVLRGLGHEIQRGESTIQHALGSLRGGGDLPADQLIALQAGVYRYSEAIDLVSRLVERATTGVKTIVQGGGQ